MKFRVPTVRVIAKCLLGVMLSFQVALAAQACLMPAFRPAAAFAGEAGMPACEQNRPAVDAVCLAQCLQSDQAVDSPHDLVSVPPAAAWTAQAQLVAVAPSGLARDAAARVTGPPIYFTSHRLRL